MTQVRVRPFRRSALALAVCAAFAGVQAQEKKEEAANTVEVQASVEAGAALVTGDSADRAFFGEYNGLRKHDFYGLLNFDYSRRDTATGTALEFYGSNLGLSVRELGALWARQGDWRLAASYGELERVNPYSVNTGVYGIGSTTPTATYLAGGPGSGWNQELSTRRRAFELAGAKWLGATYQFEASVNSENKKGAQLFGIGNSCPSTVSAGCSFVPGVTAGSGVLYFPQPIDYNHTQAEARLHYAGGSLQLNGGYYGSFFSNSKPSMTPGVPGVLNSAVNQPLTAGPGVAAYLSQPVALSPDNEHNALDVTGAYVVLPWLRTNFKLGYARTRQNHAFSDMGLTGAPAGVSSLNGEVTDTLAQLRVVANPIAKLSLVGEYRYADRNDDTPLASYSQVGTVRYTNQTVSREVNSAKLEGTYRFPWSVQGTAGVGFESIDRGTYAPTASYVGVSALREKTDETSWWIEARRSMSETVSGSVRYSMSKRDGSDWLAPAAGGVGLVGVTDPATLGAGAIYMPTLADRDRSKLRVLLTWLATDALSVQFAADVGRDEYDTPSDYALRDSRFDMYTVDVTWALSDAWNVNGYVSTGKQTLNQARPGGYILAFDDKALNVGVGVNGKPSEKLTVGGTLAFVNNVDKYAQTVGPDTTAGNAALLAATGGLPDVTFRRTLLRVFGSYALSERSTLRADAAYQRLTYDDWGYALNGVPFLYSDNSTVYLQPKQNVGYLGVTYTYAWK